MAMKPVGSQSELSDIGGSFSQNPFTVSGNATPQNDSLGNLSFGTLGWIEKLESKNAGEDADWKELEKDIRDSRPDDELQNRSVSPGSLLGNVTDVKFFEYPVFPPEPPGSRTQPPEDPTLTKLFMGNLRFEMSRSTIAWAISKASGAQLDAQNVLVHFKSSGGNPTPTGCASIHVPNQDAPSLLELNQRIFCGAKGIFVSMTSQAMKNLLRDRKVLDSGPDGKHRGPRHAVVIEPSRGTPNSSFSSMGGYRPTRMSPPPQQSPGGRAIDPMGNGHGSGMQTMVVSSGVIPGTNVQYHQYPGAPPEERQQPARPLTNPTEFFVGGICYEATKHFVAWMISLTGVVVEPEHVTLFEDQKTGNKRGCAMVSVESADFESVRAFHHRLLCDANGVYVAANRDGIPAFLRQAKAQGQAIRGPSHAVVIEKRRAQASPPPSYHNASNVDGSGHAPPPYVPGGGFPSGFGGMMPPHSFGTMTYPPMMPPGGFGAGGNFGNNFGAPFNPAFNPAALSGNTPGNRGSTGSISSTSPGNGLGGRPSGGRPQSLPVLAPGVPIHHHERTPSGGSLPEPSWRTKSPTAMASPDLPTPGTSASHLTNDSNISTASKSE